MYVRKMILVGFIVFALTVFAQTSLKLPAILSNHAVLQQSANIKLWGWAPSKSKVKIVCSWNTADTLTAFSGKDFSWNVMAKTPKAGGPYSISFLCDKQQKTISDILIGEVWLCSGQSNMEYAFNWSQGVLDAGDTVEKSANNQLRFFKLSHNYSIFPVTNSDGEWRISSPETTASMSVAGYFFGKTLSDRLHTPVGLIASYWGGSSVQVWTPSDVYNKDPKLRADAENLSPVTWSPTEPSVLYNAMIYPIRNYRIAGTIWYQGEGNSEHPELYGKLFEGLVKGWRTVFENEFPFYFVQIAPWQGYSNNKGAILREQQVSVLNLPKMGMISVGDLVDDIKDIHPRIKKEVGMRLVNLALREHYGIKDINPYFPVFKNFTVKDNKINIIFSTTGKLISKAKSPGNFQVAGDNKQFHPAEAKIKKNGSIIVYNKDVKTPIAVRYCFTSDAIPDIFDVNGLPLMPFRSDSW